MVSNGGCQPHYVSGEAAGVGVARLPMPCLLKGYPAALLGNEVGLKVGGVSRRCDSVLYHRDGGRPRAIIEYKAPSVPITQQVFTQIASYNSVLRADYLFVTNGINHYCCHIDYEAGNVEYLREIPAYTELK